MHVNADDSAEVAGHRPVDIPALTGLRAFAALAVVLYHLQGLAGQVSASPVVATLHPVISGGMLGVDVFFVLSGFVIAHTYAHRLAAPAPRAVRDYLVARLARVYPLHLATLLLMIVLLVVGAAQGVRVEAAVGAPVPHTALGLVGNLLMLQAVPGFAPWNAPSWSISCEVAAYLVFPLVAARLLRLRWPVAAVLAAVAVGLQLVVMNGLSTTEYALQGLFWPRIAGEFAAGALLWVVWRHALRPGWWGDVVVILCLLGAGSLLWRGHSGLVVVPLLVVLVPAAACATGPVGALLSHPVARWGGRISYGLYLVHVPVLAAALVWVVPADAFTRPTTGGAVLVVGGVLAAAIGAAALLHHGVEEPARRWLRDRLTSRRPEERTAAAVR